MDEWDDGLNEGRRESWLDYKLQQPHHTWFIFEAFVETVAFYVRDLHFQRILNV